MPDKRLILNRKCVMVALGVLLMGAIASLIGDLKNQAYFLSVYDLCRFNEVLGANLKLCIAICCSR